MTTNAGYSVLTQRKAIVKNTTPQTLFKLPAYSQIIDIFVDVITAWDSATSAVLTIGKTGSTTLFSSSIDIKNNTGRIAIPVTAAMATAIYGIGATDVTVIATLVETGVATVGAAKITVVYAQLESTTV